MKRAVLGLTVVAGFAAPGWSQITIANITGNSAGESMGESAVVVGDLDGDGYSELVAGMPLNDDKTTNSGAVRVISGSNGKTFVIYYGSKKEDKLGTVVAAAGDVNNDGFPDFMVQAPGVDQGSLSNVGEVRVISGKTGGTLNLLRGSASQESMGDALGGVGDLNADGFDDYLVGSGMGSYVRVYSGIDDSVLYTFTGTEPDDFFGYRAASAGDVDNDGVPDIVVGAMRADTLANNAGQVTVFSGADGGVLHVFLGTQESEEIGRAVAGAGDVNGDGHDDVIIGAPLADEAGGVNNGRVEVHSGLDGSPLFQDIGKNQDQLGYSVAGLPDIDGDGRPDVIAGARYADGIANDTGSVRLYSGQTGAMIDEFYSGQEDAYNGWAVGSAGDYNLDGVQDVFMTCPGSDLNKDAAGGVHVISTQPLTMFWPGDRVLGTVAAPYEKHEISFPGTRPMRVRFEITATGGLKPQVTLIDPQGKAKWIATLKKSTGTYKGSYKLKRFGLYRLRVTGQSGTTGGFEIETTRTDLGDMLSDSFTLKQQESDGSASSDFHVMPGAVIDVALDPNSKFVGTPKLAVIDYLGNELNLTGHVTEPGDGTLTLSGYQIPYLGRFSLRVDGFDDTGAKVAVDLQIAQPALSSEDVNIP